MFRQGAVKSKCTSWSQLNGTLYATTFLSQQKGESVTCHICSSPDHHTYQCALNDRRSAYRSTSPRRTQARSKSPEKGAGTGMLRVEGWKAHSWHIMQVEALCVPEVWGGAQGNPLPHLQEEKLTSLTWKCCLYLPNVAVTLLNC